ncbi:MAG TPA: lipase maturation factor family protein, partial [Candidatus Binatia bacterium]|nr:lipase maturation factor family protein [Candidatus Binatia bacterium]
CWRDLTCLYRHFETQPMPNPLSWYFHWLPRPLLRGGVLYNHFVELIVPFAYFLMQPFAAVAGVLTLLFHGMLFVSGNFAWLNFMTLVLSFSLLNDKVLSLVPGLARIAAAHAALPSQPVGWAVLVLAAIVAMLSVFPIINLLSPRQAMNADYNPLHLVGSYGAFGSITEKQFVVVVEGTDAEDPSSSSWKEYGFRGRPDDLDRRPPQIAPYHERLGWLMWFAGFTPPEYEPWFQNLLGKLLAGDKGIASQLSRNPFPATPPRYVRAILYEYHFTTPEERRASGNWWTRKPLGEYFPMMSLEQAERLLPSYVFR